jgi:hypothetical protein
MQATGSIVRPDWRQLAHPQPDAPIEANMLHDPMMLGRRRGEREYACLP